MIEAVGSSSPVRVRAYAHWILWLWLKWSRWFRTAVSQWTFCGFYCAPITVKIIKVSSNEKEKTDHSPSVGCQILTRAHAHADTDTQGTQTHTHMFICIESHCQASSNKLRKEALSASGIYIIFLSLFACLHRSRMLAQKPLIAENMLLPAHMFSCCKKETAKII